MEAVVSPGNEDLATAVISRTEGEFGMRLIGSKQTGAVVEFVKDKNRRNNPLRPGHKILSVDGTDCHSMEVHSVEALFAGKQRAEVQVDHNPALLQYLLRERAEESQKREEVQHLEKADAPVRSPERPLTSSKETKVKSPKKGGKVHVDLSPVCAF